MRYLVLTAFLLGLVAGTPGRAEDKNKPIRALLVIGGCCHDYAKQKDILTKGISARANVQWTIAYDPDKGTKHVNPVYEKPDWAKDFDVVVHDECCADVKDLAIINRILEPHRNGLPAVVLHCGMHCYRSEGWPKTVTPWFEFTGLPSTGHGRQQPIEVSFVDKDSPITKGLADWTTINEELYNNSMGKVLETAHPLARGKQGATETVVAWTNLYAGKTKVFATTLGHNNETVEDGRYLDLVTRGLLWSVGRLDDQKTALVEDKEEGFKSLFNGKDLTGWSGDPAHWSVKDGVIVGETTADKPARGNTFLIARDGDKDLELGDFELRASYRFDKDHRFGNSGIQFRSKHLTSNVPNDWVVAGYQADCDADGHYDGTIYEERGRGGLCGRGENMVVGGNGTKTRSGFTEPESKLKEAVKPRGEWNDYVIRAEGNHIVVKLNGHTVVNLTDNEADKRALKGILALQLHAGPPMRVEFKDVRLKVLGGEKH